MSHFIILSSARSGTQYLQTLLDSHPKITCYGEVFNPKAGHADILRKRIPAQRHQFVDYRLSNPSVFLSRALIPDTVSESIGFRLFYAHLLKHEDSRRLSDAVRAINGLKVIHLIRQNILEQYLSYQIALRAQKWRRTAKDTVHTSEEPIVLPPLEVARYFSEIEQMRAESLARFADLEIETVLYEELASSTIETMDRLQEFLDVEAAQTRSELLKQRQKSSQEVIANFKQLQLYFRNTKWGKYFEA